MSEWTTHEYDVVVIGAGGAGLRAAIEASRAGARTLIICKSLLGKAHTVMAEGGAAAALGNADDRDGWKTHFRDTMKGGKYLNNWRMAEIHAKEAADRIPVYTVPIVLLGLVAIFIIVTLKLRRVGDA